MEHDTLLSACSLINSAIVLLTVIHLLRLGRILVETRKAILTSVTPTDDGVVGSMNSEKM